MPVREVLIARAIADLFTSDSEEDTDNDGFSLLDWSVWHPPASSAIEVVKHRLRDGMMTVRFANRPLYPDYLFWNVPRELFRQWKRVKSAGAFYHRRIKGQFGV
jgi:hypothetical protein